MRTSTFWGPTGYDVFLVASSFFCLQSVIPATAGPSDASFLGRTPPEGLRGAMESWGLLGLDVSGPVLTVTLSVVLLAFLRW